jgi:hypothetical protein
MRTNLGEATDSITIPLPSHLHIITNLGEALTEVLMEVIMVGEVIPMLENKTESPTNVNESREK